MSIKMMPYLILDGNGAEAVAFYVKALGAEVMALQTFGGMPQSPDQPVPDEAKDRVANAQLSIGGAEFMLSDNYPGMAYQLGDQVSVCIITNSKEDSEALFNALADEGTIHMAFQETFWSPGYGIVTDKFGVNFQISTEA
ncbi:VOC family protein [Aureibacillus halotolerans]|uniref:PhnB protein n=1 Tax=Aureibacillus halotolerans TaxID=1508390 RepID=A0A4R6U4Q1_9BACI|nr:VOC family protein [Aureibacillus halotolerans]TDQ41141.1 PhnB protein [Aureibacillus halotolerans]